MPRHNPFTVKIEPVRGCTQRCPFCAYSNMPWQDEPFRFMEMDLFKKIVNDLAGWAPKHRMEFAERGEPTMHPQILQFLAYARLALPKVQLTITTNGDRLQNKRQEFEEWVSEAFEHGANFIMIDCYWQERYEQMQLLFPEASDFFDNGIHPYKYVGPKHKEIILVNAAPGMDNIIRFYQNQGGNVDVVKARSVGYDIPDVGKPLEKMCVRPFRELVIHYDGTIPICCNDWREETPIAKFPNDGSLEKIWDEWVDVFRYRLLKKDRATIPTCAKCSERAGFRVGLEMNWFGEKVT